MKPAKIGHKKSGDVPHHDAAGLKCEPRPECELGTAENEGDHIVAIANKRTNPRRLTMMATAQRKPMPVKV